MRARVRHGPRAVLAGLAVLVWFGVIVALTTHAAAAETADGIEATPLFLVGDGRIHEISGVAMSRRHRLLWVHNDADDSPAIFGIKPTGETQVQVRVDNGVAEDWEDIAVATVDGRDWVYLDDVGDAYLVRKARGQRFRRRFEIVRFPEPDAFTDGDKLRVSAEVFPVVFEGGEGVNVESMVVRDSGAIVLVEKLETAERPARVWQIERPTRDRANVPEVVAEIPVVGASGADVSVDGTFMVVRTARTALMYDLSNDLREAFERPVRTYALPQQQQGEGVAFTMDANGLVLTSEGESQAVWFVPLTAGADPVFGPVQMDAGASRSDRAQDGGSALGSASRWTRGAGLVRSALVLAGVLAFGLPVALWIRRRAARGAARRWATTSMSILGRNGE